MDYEYKKRSKKKDKAKRNEHYYGKHSSRHIRITQERLSNEEKKNKSMVSTQL